jgi:autotransporter translocation and assembly factor TamB
MLDLSRSFWDDLLRVRLCLLLALALVLLFGWVFLGTDEDWRVVFNAFVGLVVADDDRAAVSVPLTCLWGKVEVDDCFFDGEDEERFLVATPAVAASSAAITSVFSSGLSSNCRLLLLTCVDFLGNDRLDDDVFFCLGTDDRRFFLGFPVGAG